MPVLQIECRNQVAWVTLDRPEKLNALDQELSAALVVAGRSLAVDDGVRAIVLTGAGRAFCSGADLADPALAARPASSRGALVGSLLREVFNPIIETWALMPKPVVCAMNGVAAGGGAGLALCCDFLVMAQSARLVQVFVPRLALVPDAGVSYLLPRAVGHARALRLSMLGSDLDPHAALAAGLAHAVVDDGDVLSAAEVLAMRLAGSPRAAYAATKAVLGAQAAALRAHLDQEATMQETLANEADHLEGLKAFAEKRAPRYS